MAIVAVFVGACGSSGSTKRDLVPLPKPVTEGTLAGATCREGRCLCRDDQRKIGVPEGPVKRYEIRIGPIRNPLWVQVGKTRIYKTDETATQCFYVDLPVGKHKVRVRGHGDTGLAARVAISEMAPKEVGWYSTFEFYCGGVDVCDVDQLNAFARRLDKYKRNVHDPCGSTKIRQVRWKTGKLPDNLHPTDLQLEFLLDVYPFAPAHPPGHAKCKDKY